jgi:hypothetical protein
VAVNNPTPSGGGIGSFVRDHPALSFGIAFVGALVLWTIFSKKQSTGVSTAQDLAGVTDASGQRVVYVPTQTTFSTSNIGADYSNDPNLTTISNSPVVSNSPITVSKVTTPAPVVVTAPPPVIITKPAPPPPKPLPSPTPPPPSGGTGTGGVHPVKSPPPPPPVVKGVKWASIYIVLGGDTLSGIAQKITNQLRAAGAPSSTVVTYQQIYNYNKAVIDGTSKAHGNPIPGGPMNNIFPGEKIVVPVWK